MTSQSKLGRGDESFPSATGRRVRYAEPDEAGKKNARAARRAVEAFEAALGGPGWRAHLDEAAAVDYVLLNELFKNQDAFYSSTYLHLRGSGKLAMGPVWDFDLSTGAHARPGGVPQSARARFARCCGGRAEELDRPPCGLDRSGDRFDVG